MAVPECQKDALQRVNQFWSILDDMAQNDPNGYRTFMERQLQEGAEYFSPPQPYACLRTSVMGPKSRSLYINVCGWKRVPAPLSHTQPVPVCRGELETEMEGNEESSVVDVAYSPEVLQRADGDGQEREQVFLLALSFVQQQQGLALSQSYTVTELKLKGSVQDMKRRLTAPRQNAPSTPKPQPGKVPSLLQKIRTLRQDENEDDSSIQLDVGQEGLPPRPGLIQVLSSTEAAQPQTPRYRLSVHTPGAGTGAGRQVQLTVELPGVRAVSQCQLSVSQDDVVLEVEDLYHLHLQFPEPANEETCSATFNKKTHTLSVTLSVL